MSLEPPRQPSHSESSTVTIVRHACAGDKHAWQGDDDQRPLDPGGVDQAVALADTLVDSSVQRLVASPLRRCVDTLQPLATRLGLEVETTQRLSPDGSVTELLHDVSPQLAGAVLCTHGELMRPL